MDPNNIGSTTTPGQTRSFCKPSETRSAAGTTSVRCSLQQAETNQMPERILYRASVPIMVLAFRDNHDAAITIPVGEVLEVIGSAEDDRFTVANVRGEQVLVFESDLKNRGKLVQRAQSQSA